MSIFVDEKSESMMKKVKAAMWGADNVMVAIKGGVGLFDEDDCLVCLMNTLHSLFRGSEWTVAALVHDVTVHGYWVGTP